MKPLANRRYLVLENIGNSSVEIVEIFWKKELTVDHLLENNEQTVVFSNLQNITLRRKSKIKYAMLPLKKEVSSNFQEEDYILCVKYKTLGKVIQNKKLFQSTPIELKIVPALNIEYGWETHKINEKEDYAKSIAMNTCHVLREIADEIASL